MGRRACRATVHGVAESDMTEHRGERRTLVGVRLRDGGLCSQCGNEYISSPTFQNPLLIPAPLCKGHCDSLVSSRRPRAFRETVRRGGEGARVVRGVWWLVCVPG